MTGSRSLLVPKDRVPPTRTGVSPARTGVPLWDMLRFNRLCCRWYASCGFPQEDCLVDFYFQYWDDQLASFAQAWADRCQMNHGQVKKKPYPFKQMGQNLYYRLVSKRWDRIFITDWCQTGGRGRASTTDQRQTDVAEPLLQVSVKQMGQNFYHRSAVSNRRGKT